jgi:CHAT domain-containing protein
MIISKNSPTSVTPAQALCDAQRTISKSKKYSFPYYWAGFTLQGEWR